MGRFISAKNRISTKERIMRSLHGEEPIQRRKSWFRKTNILYPLLMIFVFAFLGLAMSAITNLQKKQQAEEAVIETMDYDTAKQILNSSGKEPEDASENSN
jgi:hypothetical protein